MPVMMRKEEGSPDDQENARKANDNWRRDIDDCQMSAGCLHGLDANLLCCEFGIEPLGEGHGLWLVAVKADGIGL